MSAITSKPILSVADTTEVAMQIRSVEREFGHIALEGFVSKNGKDEKVGELVYTIFDSNIRKDKEYGCINFPAATSIYKWYGPRPNSLERVSKVFITQLHLWGNYRYVDTRLMDAVFEVALKTCEGRIQTDAVRSEHVFYYTLGFRAMQPLTQFPEDGSEINLTPQAVDRAIEVRLNLPKEQLESEDFGSVHMYLPQESIENWKRRLSTL